MEIGIQLASFSHQKWELKTSTNKEFIESDGIWNKIIVILYRCCSKICPVWFIIIDTEVVTLLYIFLQKQSRESSITTQLSPGTSGVGNGQASTSSDNNNNEKIDMKERENAINKIRFLKREIKRDKKLTFYHLTSRSSDYTTWLRHDVTHVSKYDIHLTIKRMMTH